MASVEKIIALWPVRNQGQRLTENSAKNKGKRPEIPFRDLLKREMEQERLLRNQYLIKAKITGLPVYTTSFIKSKKGDLVVAIIETQHFDRYF